MAPVNRPIEQRDPARSHAQRGVPVSDAILGGTPVAACRDVSRTYQRRGGGGLFSRGRSSPPAVTALDSVSLTIERSEFVGLTGPSGSGKSTLLHLLAGLDTPTAGTVELVGRSIGGLGERARTRLRLDHVGVVFQRFHLLPSLSARANVALPLVELGWSKRDRRERATALLEQVGLGDRLGHQPGELSGGEQQRVAVARALATDPDVLIADEPTGELDTETGAQIIDLLSTFAEERAVVVASHDEHVVTAVDRVIRLRDGRLEG